MTFDVTQSVQQVFTELLAGIFGSETQALSFIQDPYGELEDKGLTNQDLSSINVQQAVVDACNYPGVPEYAKQNLESYSSDHYAAPQTIQDVVQQVTQVTQVVYQDNDTIVNEIQQNNTNINVGDNFNGDIDVDNVNADDGGVANSGDGAQVNAATGAGAVANQNSDVNAPIVTGPNSGIIADGDVTNAVAGTGNTVGTQANNSSLGDVAQGFGSGPVIQNSDIDDSAVGTNASNISDLDDVAFGPNSTNVSDNTLDGGSGISTGGDVTASQDNDDFSNTNNVSNSQNVVTEQGPGDQNLDAGPDPDMDPDPQPLL
jgi:hypothetical protein